MQKKMYVKGLKFLFISMCESMQFYVMLDVRTLLLDDDWASDIVGGFATDYACLAFCIIA